MLQNFAIIDDTSVMNFRKKLQHNFPKMRGGGQRPFGTFLKSHPFWKGSASLRVLRNVYTEMFGLFNKNFYMYVKNERALVTFVNPIFCCPSPDIHGT